METKELDVKSFSQAGQDAFVACVLDGKHGGTFVDLGAGDPYKYSNTFILESVFGWRGILADIETKDDLVDRRARGNVVYGDALDPALFLDIVEMADRNGGSIDYLSLDLEPPDITLVCLANLPLDRVRFRVLTVEHDRYRGNSVLKYAMRGILEGFGYEPVAEDVRMIAKLDDGRHVLVPVEDWWIDPDLVEAEVAREIADAIRSESESRATKIIEKLNAEISQHG